MTTRIALIHAVSVAMRPVEDAFAREWPEAERVNLLDDSLSIDRAKSVELTPALFDRIGNLAALAHDAGADAILFTCSAFGAAIEAVAAQASIPVLTPNEAMFEAALAHGKTIGMVATFAPSVASMEDEFREAASKAVSTATIKSVCVPEAMAALKLGDAATHNALVAEAANQLVHCDAIMLAQFSTAQAAEAVALAVNRTVLTSPGAAVSKLKRRLGAA